MAEKKSSLVINGQTYPLDDLPDAITMALRKPVVIGDQTYDVLELREPLAGEFQKFTKIAATDPAGALIILIASVTGIAEPIIKKIGVRDMNLASTYLTGFMQGDQQTEMS